MRKPLLWLASLLPLVKTAVAQAASVPALPGPPLRGRRGSDDRRAGDERTSGRGGCGGAGGAGRCAGRGWAL